MRLFLVRHGQTLSNRDRILQTPDTPLSDTGHQQAIELAAHFQTIELAKVLCSVHTRTQQTIAPLMQQQSCPVTLSDLLTERSFGDLRGRSYDDIGEDFFAHDYQPPNGESGVQFSQRIANAWDYIIDQALSCDGNTLVMTHGLVLRTILGNHLGIHPEQIEQAGFHNTCVTEVAIKDNNRIVRLCDTRHLSDVSHNAAKSGAAV